MCPETRKVPNTRLKILTKDAKQMVTGPYYCPQCKKELLQILASKKNQKVFAVCRCGLEEELTFAPVFQPVDYYNKFRDSAKKRTLSDWERINAEKAKKAEQKR